MTFEMLFVFGLLAVTIALFISDRLRMDLVALMVVAVLAVSGIISPTQAVSGFGDPVIIMIAALFVVGEALFRTGVAATAGNWLLRVGDGSETRLLLFLLPVVALLSAFMSSTGAVALLIPVVLSMARKSGLQASRLLMPLAFAALIGGMLTLIGTPPNIIVSGQLRAAGFEAFGFFDFTAIGAVILFLGVLYLVFIARFLLPQSAIRETGNPHPTLSVFTERYPTAKQLHKLIIQPGSPLNGQTLSEAAVRSQYELTVFAVQRQGQFLSTLQPVLSQTRMQALDTLILYGRDEDVHNFCQALQLRRLGFPETEMMKLQQRFGLAEILLPPDSPLTNHTLKEGRFRENYNLSVIGVRRQGLALDTRFIDTRLAAGDTLLLAGAWEYIRALESKRELVVLETPAELQEIPVHAGKAHMALSIMLAMLMSMTLGWLPNLSAILLAALAMILTGCVTLSEAYRSLNATSLVLIAGMLPLALAMESSGALSFVVDYLIREYGNLSPILLCAGLFLMTSVLSQFISNTATTVLVAPVALMTAQTLGLNPEPFMMSVAIAASTAFATPIASPVNTLVLAPGNYRFADFAKVGIPLQILALAVTLALVPWLFPF
ncbi:SLC13 family permease [Nitrincola tapanii]|uniref:Sodium:solute symporter n=1 Tax=Nitrincola tapanii TaxID=1708751 RepID=A0A5A9W2G5_9GAMM|nr:SLC13 family permease [Nitrincola tapanii]KAA0874285.1 sodium:solute symporter [Nitrincola tapanii]